VFSFVGSNPQDSEQEQLDESEELQSTLLLEELLEYELELLELDEDELLEYELQLLELDQEELLEYSLELLELGEEDELLG